MHIDFEGLLCMNSIHCNELYSCFCLAEFVADRSARERQNRKK